MNENEATIYDKAKVLWFNISKNDPLKGPTMKLKNPKEMLNLFSIGKFYYYYFNLATAEFDFISPEIEEVLGYDPQTLKAVDFVNYIHPEDRPYFLKFEDANVSFFKTLDSDQFLRYKIQYDYRVRTKSGEYKRILHQLMILEFNEKKGILRSLGIHTDISHIKKEGIPVLSFIGFDNDPSYFDVFEKDNSLKLSPVKSLYSKREKEILKFIIEGKTSLLIAEELYISLHTVNAHRKNILAKSGCKTVAELIAKTIQHAWI